jgi:cobalt/nickel transport system permease protein
MHMADALLSPAIGGAFWVLSAGLIGYSAKKITTENDIAKTPLMGVMGAFIFAAQMINFAIPGTGSSGHIGGGLLLSVILGPWRAFLTLASVLVIQCLFFADGGLLALGCNIFNLAFFPAFIAYPFVFRKIAGNSGMPVRLVTGSIVAAVVGLEFGAFSVVVQTILSGNSDLSFGTFMLFMLPIHLAIGAVEGFVTWAVLAFVGRVQPSLVAETSVNSVEKPVTVILAMAAIVIGGVAAYIASDHPDGLEWSIGKAQQQTEPAVGSQSGFSAALQSLQEKISLFPDYTFKTPESNSNSVTGNDLQSIGTSVAGITGSLLVLAAALSLGFLVRRKSTVHGG